MRFYVASRFRLKEEIREIYEKIRKRGHEVVYDWTGENLIRPYGEHEEESKEIAIKSIEASESCDVFILISDSEGTDMYGELGAAIVSKKPKIYVIGDFLDKSKLFFHPRVKRMKNLENVLEDLGLI